MAAEWQWLRWWRLLAAYTFIELDLDADGAFSIVDRKKDMILRGGFNVYPREVEEILYSHEAIIEALKDGDRERLAALCVDHQHPSSEAYIEAYEKLFSALDRLEQRLADRRFLTGEFQTEADWRLFTTLVRFDPVYVGHFKCNLRRLADQNLVFPDIKAAGTKSSRSSSKRSGSPAS